MRYEPDKICLEKGEIIKTKIHPYHTKLSPREPARNYYYRVESVFPEVILLTRIEYTADGWKDLFKTSMSAKDWIFCEYTRVERS